MIAPLLVLAVGVDAKKWLSPEYANLFAVQLRIPPEIKAIEYVIVSMRAWLILSSYTPLDGPSIDLYQPNISAFEQEIYHGKSAQLVDTMACLHARPFTLNTIY